MNKLFVTGLTVLFCSSFAIAHGHHSTGEHRSLWDKSKTEAMALTRNHSSEICADEDYVSSFGKKYEVHGAHITMGIGSPYYSQFNFFDDLNDNDTRTAE